MEQKEKEEGNLLIAQFEGYVYYEADVLADYSDCGGLYEKFEVFSKVPIEVKDYGDGQKYFKDIPNPDYQKAKPIQWNPSRESLGWDTLNGEHYITELKYDFDWNELMRIVEKITMEHESVTIETGNINTYCQIVMANHKITNVGTPIESTWRTVVDFIKWLNAQNEKE